MEQSILISVKKILGLDADYTAFDHDVITHINTSFSTLHQLGLGPINGFMIEDDEAVWDEFIEDDATYNTVRTYVYLVVRLLFDPPATSFALAALQEQIRQFEWRLNVHREDTEWIDPDPDDEIEEGEEVTLEGGGP